MTVPPPTVRLAHCGPPEALAKGLAPGADQAARAEFLGLARG